MQATKIKRERIVFTRQQWVDVRTTKLRYTYIAYLFVAVIPISTIRVIRTATYAVTYKGP
jgi:hypothetical protein